MGLDVQQDGGWIVCRQAESGIRAPSCRTQARGRRLSEWSGLYGLAAWAGCGERSRTRCRQSGGDLLYFCRPRETWRLVANRICGTGFGTHCRPIGDAGWKGADEWLPCRDIDRWTQLEPGGEHFRTDGRLPFPAKDTHPFSACPSGTGKAGTVDFARGCIGSGREGRRIAESERFVWGIGYRDTGCNAGRWTAEPAPEKGIREIRAKSGNHLTEDMR